MTIRCLFLGCQWHNPQHWASLGERLTDWTCQRCGAKKTEIAE